MITRTGIQRRPIVKLSPSTFVLVMSAAAVLLMASGCSDDDPVQVQPDPVTGPATTDELVAQFRGAYETKNVENYLALLDPDFEMILSGETIFDFPDVGPTLVFTEEEQIHRRMFSGENVYDPDGDLVPGIQGINIPVFMALAAWTPTIAPDPFPDTVWAPFQLVIHFDRGQQFSTLKVEGTVKIYARAHETMVAGTARTYFLMAGMVDLTQFKKSTETLSWGSVKALYR